MNLVLFFPSIVACAIYRREYSVILLSVEMEEHDSNHKEPSTEVVVLGDVPAITDAELPPPPITEKKEEVIIEEVKEMNVPGQDGNNINEPEETKVEGVEGDDDMIPTSVTSAKRMSTVAKGTIRVFA